MRIKNPREFVAELEAGGCLLIIIVLVAVLGFSFWRFEFDTQARDVFTVKSLQDQASKNGHKYLVFTTKGEVLQNTDAWLHGKHDSSNIQAWLTVGHTYDCPVYGWRNFITSSYRDILDGCRDITPGATQVTVP